MDRTADGPVVDGRSWRLPNNPPTADPITAAVRGYRRVPTSERACFSILSSCACTMFTARTATYVQERRRRLPAIRSLGRRAFNLPRKGSIRVHHFLPGMVVAVATGAAAILTRTDGEEMRFGLPFGVGVALALDELALLVDADNAYWKSERLASPVPRRHR